jgi:TnpA family transposase
MVDRQNTVIGRELNKGEASHDLSRFVCFGKEGVFRGREFGDQVHTFSCLSVLHNDAVAWNMIQIALQATSRETG